MEWKEKLWGKPWCFVDILMLFDLFGIAENSQLENFLANKASVFFFIFIFGQLTVYFYVIKTKQQLAP